MLSRALKSVFPVALWSFLSIDHPLYQGIYIQKAHMLREVQKDLIEQVLI